MTVRRALGLPGILLCLLAGCSADPTRGYSFTPTHDERIRTIAVPIFENHTFEQGLEVRLTDAVIKEIQRTTPWAVVQGDAQTRLDGALRGARMIHLTTGRRTGLVQEVGVELIADFTWTDRAGRVLVSRRSFQTTDFFVPANPVGERLELGQDAAVQELARAIVGEMRSNW